MNVVAELTRSEAEEQMRKYMTNPGAYQNSPLTKASAELLFGDTRLHQCYWNNRFAVAVMCGMDEKRQRQAAWCAVSNGINGYWEWSTHAGYDMGIVLRYLGVVDSNFKTPRRDGLVYENLDRQIIAKLIEKFDLPTSHGSRKILSASQQKERHEFNGNYIHTTVL